MSDAATRPLAVVTGASSGIGEATVRRLAARGWRCVLVARREELLRSLAAEVDGEVEAFDVSDRDAVLAATARIRLRHPHVNLLVNGAGILAKGSFADAPLDLVEQALAVNYLGGVWTTRGLLDALRAAAAAGEPAHVVDLVSTGGTIVFTPAAPYSASKHAQVAFSRSLRAALDGTGIRVHTVLPGFVTTPGFPHPTVFSTRIGRRFVVGPDDVARRIVRLVETGGDEATIPWFPYAIGAATQALLPSLTARVLGWARYPDDHASARPPDVPGR